MSSMEQATLFSKHKKRQILKERGYDVEKIDRERSYMQLASKITDGPLSNLEGNFFEENKAFEFNHSELMKKFENASEFDMLEYLVSETLHDTESLDNLSNMDRSIQHKKEDLDAMKYEEILDKIDEIKKSIPTLQNVSVKKSKKNEENQQEYGKWNTTEYEKEFLENLFRNNLNQIQ